MHRIVPVIELRDGISRSISDEYKHSLTSPFQKLQIRFELRAH